MCSNDAVVSAKYDNAGGILGYGSRGFLLGCESGGSVKAGREYAAVLPEDFQEQFVNAAALLHSPAKLMSAELREVRNR